MAVALATVGAQLPFFDRFFSAMDEGHILLFADMIRQGAVLYRDATSYPLPGAFHLLALAFAVFEPSILVARWIVVVEFAVFCAGLFAWMRWLMPAPWPWIGVGALWLYRVWSFPHWHMYNYSSTALVVLLGSLLLLGLFLRSGRRVHLALSGLAFGLGVYCKQDFGAAVLLAVAATLTVAARTAPRPRPSLAALFAVFLGPAAAVGAAAGLLFLAQGQLGYVVHITVLNHFVGLSEYAYESFPGLLPLFRQDPVLRSPSGINSFFPPIVSVAHGLEVQRSALFLHTALYDTAMKLFIFAPRLLVLAGLVLVWRRRADLREDATRFAGLAGVQLAATAAAFALLSALYRPQDYVHLAVAYAWFAVLGLWLLQRALAGRPAWIGAALALPAALFAGYSVWLALALRVVFSEPIPLPRAGVRVKPSEAALLADVVEYVTHHSEPGEVVAVMPYFPIVQFLADRRGPHAASYILWPFPEYPDRDRRIIDAMEADGTRLLIWNYTQFPHFPPVEEYAPELYRYLVDRYRVVRVFNRVTFGYTLAALEREEAPVGRPLLQDPTRAEIRVERPRRTRSVPAAQRGEFVRAEVWPFRPVWSLRPLPGARTVLSLPLEVPEGAHLRTAVGTHPDVWFRHPASQVRFAIRVVDGDRRTPLFARALNPHLVLEDRGWFDVDVSLAEFAGRTVTLELVTLLEGAPMAAEDAARMGGWSVPRLVRPAPEAP